MHTTKVRQVGGSVMLAVPRTILETIGITVGSTVGIAVDGGRLLVEPVSPRPRYKLEDLLAQCDPEAEILAQEREWLDDATAGNELI